MLPIKVHNSFWTRLVGLLNQRDPEFGFLAYFPHTKRIHTIGMRFSIDVVCLDKKNKVLKIFFSFPPYKILPQVRGTENILEMPVGEAERMELSEGKIVDALRA